MRWRRTFIWTLLVMTLVGCGSVDDPPIRAGERDTAREQHPYLLAEFGGSYDSDEARYLVSIGDTVARAAALGDQCTFTLVNSDVVNAFAVPGCYIYVTRGMMSIVNSEGELAAVLAHEVGHIVGRHSRRQQNRSLWRGLGVLAVDLVTGSDRLTRIAGKAAALFTLRYSRKHEYEADDLGLTYLREAGYDPYAAADMLKALGSHERFVARTQGRDEARSIPEWVRTHPLTENRIARAQEAARATGLNPDTLPENEVRYLRVLDGLLYGDDPAQGFVLGRRFAHPMMRIAFDAPPAFTLTNSPRSILIEGPDGLRGEFVGGPLPPGGLEPYADIVLGDLLGNAQLHAGRAQRTEINGVPSLILPASVETADGQVQLTFAAYAGEGGSAYHFILLSDPARSPTEAIGVLIRSFRLLSPQEARSLRARRIQTISVRAGDTIASLAARMAGESKVDHFLMLNGLDRDRSPRPGQLVKVVAAADR